MQQSYCGTVADDVKRSSQAGDDGRKPGPGWGKCTVYCQAGTGCLPWALRLSEGFGHTALGLWVGSALVLSQRSQHPV